jgi:hypothetical protein
MVFHVSSRLYAARVFFHILYKELNIFKNYFILLYFDCNFL